MNTGVISERYAKALLMLTRESKRGEQVCSQVKAMLRNPDEVPQPLEEDLQRLVALLARNGRLQYLRFVFNTFVRMYYRSEGICPARLVSAERYEGLEEKVRGILEKQTGSKVILESETDPSLIGGFKVEVNDTILDASLAHQIELLRKQFANQNKRTE